MCLTNVYDSNALHKGTFFRFLVMAALGSDIARLQQNDPAMTELEFVMFCLIFGEKLTGGV